MLPDQVDEGKIDPSLSTLSITDTPRANDSSTAPMIDGAFRDPLKPTNYFPFAANDDAFIKSILDDMTITIDHPRFAHLSSILVKPLPFDFANQCSSDSDDHSFFPELVDSAGSSTLKQDILKAAQQKRVIFELGVSGLGKTKTAYDIGRTEAFVVMLRMHEDNTTVPIWEYFSRFIKDLRNQMKSSSILSTHLAAIAHAALTVFVMCHYEWMATAKQIAASFDGELEAAIIVKSTYSEEFAKLTPELKRTTVLREVVLRAQRNAHAYARIWNLFRAKMEKFCSLFSLERFSSKHVLSEEFWNIACMDGEKVFFVYDEVQTLLSPTIDVDNIFQSPSSFSNVSDPTKHSSPSLGLFHGLLCVLSDLVVFSKSSHFNSYHLLLSTHYEITAHVVHQFSPVNGMHLVLSSSVHISCSDIVAWLKMYLLPDAVAAVDKKYLEMLQGRGFFISQFLPALLTSTFSKTDSLEQIMDIIVKTTIKEVDRRMMIIVEKFWNREVPLANTSFYTPRVTPKQAAATYYHMVIMKQRPDAKSLLEEGFPWQECVKLGIFNASLSPGPESSAICVREPLVEHQLFALVDMHIKLARSDPVMEVLSHNYVETANTATHLAGPTQENCTAWYLVRECRRNPGICLSQLLHGLLPPHNPMSKFSVDLSSSLEDLSNFEVTIKGGRACSEVFSLADLYNSPHLLFHSPPNILSGPDILFVAKHRETGELKPVYLQLKNTKDETFESSIKTLDSSTWYPAPTLINRKKRELEFLKANPTWNNPVRGVVSSRAYSHSLLITVALLNVDVNKSSPLLLLRPNPDAFGINIISATTSGEMSLPQAKTISTSRLWPSGISPTEKRTFASNTVTLSSAASVELLTNRVASLFNYKPEVHLVQTSTTRRWWKKHNTVIVNVPSLRALVEFMTDTNITADCHPVTAVMDSKPVLRHA